MRRRSFLHASDPASHADWLSNASSTSQGRKTGTWEAQDAESLFSFRLIHHRGKGAKRSIGKRKTPKAFFSFRLIHATQSNVERGIGMLIEAFVVGCLFPLKPHGFAEAKPVCFTRFSNNTPKTTHPTLVVLFVLCRGELKRLF